MKKLIIFISIVCFYKTSKAQWIVTNNPSEASCYSKVNSISSYYGFCHYDVDAFKTTNFKFFTSVYTNPNFSLLTGRGGNATVPALILGTDHKERMRITPTGNVGIGTTNPGSYKLAVEGKIGCREVVVTQNAWADFVFNDDYKLKSLSEVEQFIKENKHLPDVPSEKQVLQQGNNLGKMDATLLQKIEELTLYIIDLKKENDELKAINNNLEQRISRLEYNK